ncbi:MAG: hypothetical protein HY466_00010 [Deltaproteobacteria bacterium]|nr:hypothetical protein [Deltaproteobacteria bacterium]
MKTPLWMVAPLLVALAGAAPLSCTPRRKEMGGDQVETKTEKAKKERRTKPLPEGAVAK